MKATVNSIYCGPMVTAALCSLIACGPKPTKTLAPAAQAASSPAVPAQPTIVAKDIDPSTLNSFDEPDGDINRISASNDPLPSLVANSYAALRQNLILQGFTPYNVNGEKPSLYCTGRSPCDPIPMPEIENCDKLDNCDALFAKDNKILEVTISSMHNDVGCYSPALEQDDGVKVSPKAKWISPVIIDALRRRNIKNSDASTNDTSCK